MVKKKKKTKYCKNRMNFGFLASQNGIEQRGGHLLQMLQGDKHQGVEKAAPRQEQEKHQYIQAVNDGAAMWSAEFWSSLWMAKTGHSRQCSVIQLLVVVGRSGGFLYLCSHLFMPCSLKSPHTVSLHCERENAALESLCLGMNTLSFHFKDEISSGYSHKYSLLPHTDNRKYYQAFKALLQ